MNPIKLLSLGLGIALLSACASQKNTLTKEQRAVAYTEYIAEQKLEQLDKIRSFRLHGWSSLGDKHLIISTSLNRPYLITLRRKCHNLDYSQAIKVHNNSGMLQAKFDYITPLDGVEINCYIESIHKLTRDQKKAMLAIGKPVDEEKEAKAGKDKV